MAGDHGLLGFADVGQSVPHEMHAVVVEEVDGALVV
jgi:hypothetical protein